MKKSRYKYALVSFPGGTKEFDRYTVELKKFLRVYSAFAHYTVVCDDQPYKVLQGMLKLLEEK